MSPSQGTQNGISAATRKQRIAPASSVISYDKRLNLDSGWALTEGSIFFEGRGAVHDTLRKITKRLNDLGIPYSIVGGMALFHHGYRYFTEDVDILVTPESLRQIHEKLEGLGYLPPHQNSKHLRDTESGVKVEFLITGGYPGDGKPKPVAFPDPRTVSIEADGIKYLNLNTLIELKLASGMTGGIDRSKDITAIVELIKALKLPLDVADQLNPYVRDKYKELWHGTRKRYVRLWRNKFLTLDAKSLDEMAATLRSAAEEFEAMRKDGVVLDPDGGTADDYAHLITTDPKIAEKYGFVDEAEYWNEDEKNASDDEGVASEGAG